MTFRNDYRNWTPEFIREDAIATFKRSRLNGMLLSNLVDKDTLKPVPMLWADYEFAIERLGLRLLPSTTYKTDDDGKIVNDEKGNPIVEKAAIVPPHRVSIVVKAVGFVDAYGTAIPKGKQYFELDNEATNRVPTESNYKDLANRLPHWVFTLESLIKDNEGSGQNEQHRMLAIVFDQLSDARKLPEGGIPVLTLDGVSVGAAGAIDTGKKKTATDDLSTNHELLPMPLTYADFRNNTENGFAGLSVQTRVRILKELQSAVKRVVNRMLGKNIKASLFTGDESATNVEHIVASWIGIDTLANIAYTYLDVIPLKGQDKQALRPTTAGELLTAYLLYTLRSSEKLASVDKLTEYVYPEVSDTVIEEFKAFCDDMVNACIRSEGPLVEFCKERVTKDRLKDKPEQSIAQMLMSIVAYTASQPVERTLCHAGATSTDKQNGSKYFYVGGGDCGPIKKEKKSDKASE